MINIGNQRECFFDTYLIDEEKSTAEIRLHKPQREKVLFELDQPWEGNLCTFFSMIFAEGLWKAYYVCNLGKAKYVCYLESTDAENWTRPNLGIIEFEGSKENNIIFDLEKLKEFDFTGFDNMSVFYDDNPLCPSDEKYKMVAWWQGHAALTTLMSADGIHFTKQVFITDDGAFDSQNRAFYSKAHQKYFCYYRGEHEPNEHTNIMDKSYTDGTANALFDPEKFLLREPGAGTHSFLRDVRVTESEDFIHWSKQQKIDTTGADCQLYNNCIFPYPRAPHMIIGFPLRYAERKAWTKNYDELCGKEDRIDRVHRMARLGLAVTDGLFIAGRDGYRFKKYDEALFPPPPENPEAFVYGDGTAVPALFEVPSKIPGADNEYMMILRESFRTARGYNKLVKYTIRLDGFVSLHAGGEVKKAVTKEFTYDGGDLYANIATSARGSAYFKLKCGDEEYTSVEMFGNATHKRIRFEDDEAVRRLSGKPIVLEMELYDCDVYSIKFE